MKSLFDRLILITFLLLIVAACAKKSETSSSDEWPEMDSFHMVMAEAFHPYKDSANVEPVKRLAGEMALEAARWQSSDLPDKVNTDEVKGQLEKLMVGTRALADQVKAGASDEEIGTALTTLHDSFHRITEAWHGGGEKHKH